MKRLAINYAAIAEETWELLVPIAFVVAALFTMTLFRNAAIRCREERQLPLGKSSASSGMRRRRRVRNHPNRDEETTS